MGSKHSLLMKSGQFMSYYKRKKICQKILQELQSQKFHALLCLQKNLAQPLLENEIFEASYLDIY